MPKNHTISFIILFFIISAGFFFLPQNKVFSADLQLEVAYPVLGTGAKITAQSDLTEYLKYVFDFGIMIGFFFVFLSLAWAGALYFLSPAIPGALNDVKDRISGAITGMVILVLLYLIIVTINPYLAIFKLGEIEPVPLPEPNTSYPGVTLYESENCSGTSNTYTNNVSDLGSLNNKVQSVGISQNPEEKLYYIAVLYDINGNWGKCQYINPNNPCAPKIDPFAASASIYQYDFYPKGDGIYLYRKPFDQIPGKEENKKGGYLKITNSQIGKGTLLYLPNLRFTGMSSNYNNLRDCSVPEEEQDCAKYDEKGKCTQKECPKLSEKNISSIYISGDYLVLLVYFAPGDNPQGPWTYCQAYASNNDVNKEGPEQIKWDAVRNQGKDPNWIAIIPIKEK